MDKQKALELINLVINESLKAGLFKDMNAAVNVSNAFNLIHTELLKDVQENAQ